MKATFTGSLSFMANLSLHKSKQKLRKFWYHLSFYLLRENNIHYRWCRALCFSVPFFLIWLSCLNKETFISQLELYFVKIVSRSKSKFEQLHNSADLDICEFKTLLCAEFNTFLLVKIQIHPHKWHIDLFPI